LTGPEDWKVGLRRLVAFCVDWLLIALWGSVLFGAVMALTGGRGTSVGDPWTSQAIGLVTMTIPVTLYFALTESSGWQASVGKRILRLRVTSASGERLSPGRSLLRNAVKFIPWELGHTVAQQAAFAGDARVPLWVWLISAVSFGIPLIWVITVLLRNRTPYDVWAGAAVSAR
jgi:uncharacterized RDD family membrane protein YckC